MTDEIRHQLEAAGRRPAPEPGPEFADALEARLMAVATNRAPAVAQPPRRRWGRLRLPERWLRVRLTAGVAVLAVVLIGVAVAGGLADRGTPNLELTGATNVEVALADGTTLVNPDGLLLPDGAVIRVGVEGAARIGDVQLGAGDVATVADRRLRIDRRGMTGLVEPGDSVAPASSAAPASSTSPSASPTKAPPASQPPQTPRPAGTAAAFATPPSDRPTPSSTVSPRTSSAPTVDVVRLKLSAKAVGPSDIGAIWTGLPKASSYVLVASASRQGPAADPRYPGSTVIGEFAYPPKDPLRFRVPSGVGQIRLMVVALTADGSELTRSNIVTVPLGG